MYQAIASAKRIILQDQDTTNFHHKYV